MPRQSQQQIAIFLFIILMAPCVGAENTPDITGTWLLNQQLSDNFQQQIRELLKTVRKNRSRPDGYSGATSGGNKGDSGRRPSGAQQHARTDRDSYSESLQPELGTMMLFHNKMKIIQNDHEIVIAYSETEGRTIYTDDRGITVTASGSTSNPLGPYIASWNTDKQLVIETITDRGIKIKELCARSPDRKQLHTRIRIKFPVSDKSVDVVRIYDLIDEYKTVE